MKHCFLTTLITATMMAEACGSRVLMVMPLGSISHKNIFTPLAEALGSRGHDVTLVSLYASSTNTSRSYNDLAAITAWDTIRRVNGEFDVFKLRAVNGGWDVNSQVMQKMVKNLPEFCEAFLTDPAVQSAWATTPDLIFLPAFMNECGLVIVAKFRTPFIYVTTSGLTSWTADLVGNPENPAFVPSQYLSYNEDMTLWERTMNSIIRFVSPILRRQFLLNRLNDVAQRFLAEPSVSLAEVERNVSLVLVNSHYSLGYPRPMLPNVVEVGAMHCRPSRPLQDMQLLQFLDESPVVVYFSLGSHIRSSQIPLNLKKVLVTAFARLSYRVLWKWEGDPISNLSSNVMTRTWLPQQDVLGHPNVRAFMTHGGLLSQQEAVYHGVPMVGLPLMSDQPLNVRKAVKLGLSTELTLETMTEELIVDAVRKVVEDPGYSQRIKERSLLLRHQETTPLSRAVFWSEHVLQHRGAQHLRSSSTNMPLHQYLLLDVMALLSLGLLVMGAILALVTRKVGQGLLWCGRKVFLRLTSSFVRSAGLHDTK